MALLLFDAFDVAVSNVNAAGVMSAQISAAEVDVIARVSVAGTIAAQVSAAAAAVSGSGAPAHSEAPLARLFLVTARTKTAVAAPAKDPNELLDYTITYKKLLEPGEVLTLSTWTIAAGLGAISQGDGAHASTFGNQSATIWLGQATPGFTYRVTNHIKTNHSPPREYERSFTVSVIDI